MRDEFLPVLYEQFERSPSTQPAFFSLNEDLRSTVRRGAAQADDMRRFDRPVRVVFGRELVIAPVDVEPGLFRELLVDRLLALEEAHYYCYWGSMSP